LVSRGKKIAREIERVTKHCVIFTDYFQVCISKKKKGKVENLSVSQSLGWIITEIFHGRVIHKIFPFMVVTFNNILLIKKLSSNEANFQPPWDMKMLLASLHITNRFQKNTKKSEKNT
jgi:hypothetical protein